MTAGIRSLAAALSAAAAAVSEPADAPSAATERAGSKQQQQQTLQDLLEPADHRRMFVSIASSVMLTYSGAAAQLLHHMPLVLVLSAPHTLQLLSPSTVRGVYQLCSAHGQCLQGPCLRQHALCMVVLWRLSVLACPAFQATHLAPICHDLSVTSAPGFVCCAALLLPPPPFLPQALPAAEGLRVVLAAAGRTLVTLVLVLGVPAGLGALRAVLSGELGRRTLAAAAPTAGHRLHLTGSLPFLCC